MRHEKLIEPIDGAEPCGPDLDEVGDEDYLNYMLPAEDRLPGRFFDGNGAPFDRSTIDLKAEVQAISDLLAKSRDLRLLALEARFQILAGQIVGFCDCIRAIGGLVEHYWADVHPKPFEGDYTMRQNTLAALDDRGKIILPLQYAPIVRDKRLGHLSYRQYVLAKGQAQAREGEVAPDMGALMDALRNEDNRAAAHEAHTALVAARESISAIRNKFIDEAGYDYAPNLDGVSEAIDEVIAMIASASPELAGNAGSAGQADPLQESSPAQADGSPAAASAGPVATPELAGASIRSQAEARAALSAAERYFLGAEPSAPALVLVHQARMLIGKPLVAAIDALMPERADSAIIRFDGTYRFQIDMSRMRSLTDGATAADVEIPAIEGEVEIFDAHSRGEAASLIAGVEAYYRAAEPSSPIPMLLARARGYLSRDFLAILKELIEKEVEGN